MDINAEHTRTLYCGNLADEVTEEILYELCLQAGPIEKISIPSRSGKRQNFGFVTYKHVVSVAYAMKLLSEETLFKKKIVLRARDQGVESAKNSPSREERRNSSPDIAVIHENKRRSFHQSPARHQPQFVSPAAFNNQVVYMMNRQSNGFINNPLSLYNPSQIHPQQYMTFQPMPNQVPVSSPIYLPNRYPKWK